MIRPLLSALLVASALLSGCGQKGPLFIPPEPPAAPADTGNSDAPGDDSAASTH